jgi:hypothetical protein
LFGTGGTSEVAASWVGGTICGCIPGNEGVAGAIGPAYCPALGGTGGIEGVGTAGPPYCSTGIGAGDGANEEAIGSAYCATFGAIEGSEGVDGVGSGTGNWGGWTRIATGASCLGPRLCTIPGIFLGIPQYLLL